MKLFRWFGTLLGIAAVTAPPPSQAMPPKNEHAVVVHFAYGSKDLTKLFALEEELEKAMLAAGVGEFDENEVNVDGSDGYLYMYGPNADSLFSAIKPILEKLPLCAAQKPSCAMAHHRLVRRKKSLSSIPKIAVKATPPGRWTLHYKAWRSVLYLQC